MKLHRGVYVILVITVAICVLDSEGCCQESCSVYINSDPSGAEVILDSLWLGVTTPIRLNDIPAGFHVIRLEKGELEGEKEITLQPNIISRIDIPLSPKRAILVITSEPAGAEVTVDRQARGRTPYRYEAPGLRTYRLGVRSIGYLPEAREVDLTKTGTSEVHFLLRRYGEVRIESDPSGAEVYIDGGFSGRTPEDFRLAEGTHIVLLKRVGNRDHSQEVEVLAGEPLDISVTLVPENGELTVLGLPEGSVLTLDGELLGNAPIENQIVPSGPHWLQCKSEGFEPLGDPIWVSVQGRQETVVEIQLQEKTRWNALWRSLLLPGLGQMYSEQPLKGITFLGAGTLCVVGTVLYHYQVNNAKDNYHIAHDLYLKERTPYSIEAARQNMIAKHDLMKDKVDTRNTLMFATAAVWALNCLDQILFSSTPWEGGVQATTRLSFRGKMQQETIGCQLAIQW
jgi:hypothetical protein